MKSKEEIEKLAEKYAESFRLKISSSSWHEEKCDDFINGYNQCQEYMADKKYTIKEVERYHDIRATQGIKNANNYIKSLNKQD